MAFRDTILLAVISTFLVRCAEEETHIRSLKADSAELVNFIEDVRNAHELPSIGAAVVIGGEVFSEVIGSRDLNDSIVYFMGNLSEVMVATTIAKLVSENRIGLDDPVAKHLPYFRLGNEQHEEITIRHLLTQSSGIPKHNAVWDIPYDGDDALKRTTVSIAEQQPEFTAGTKVKRSQYNFDILADLIRHVSGTSFEEFTSKNIFAPLKMHSSSFDVKSLPDHLVAKPHAIHNWLSLQRDSIDRYPYNPEHSGSIGFHSSIHDVGKLMSTLLNETGFLRPEVQKEFLTSQYRTGKDTFVGLGWEGAKGNKLVLTKDHQIGGFSGAMTFVPEDKIGVAIVSNSSDQFDAHLISQQIISWIYNGRLKKPKTPVYIAMARKLNQTEQIDSALSVYTILKDQSNEHFDFSEEALSEFGVLLAHKLARYEDAKHVFRFVKKEFPESKIVSINLAETLVLQDSIVQAELELSRAKGLVGKNPAVTAHLAYLTEIINTKKEQRNYEHTTLMSMPE